MLSTNNTNYNSLVYANSATFNNISIKGFITNDSLTNSLTTISGNIINFNSSINTISGSLNNVTNYITITIWGDVNLNCNKFNSNSLNYIKPQPNSQII